MFPSIWRGPLGVVALCMCLVSPPSRAADDFDGCLAQAVRLYESLEYEHALAQLEQCRSLARQSGEQVRVSLHEGIVLANLGRWERARNAFRDGLLKDPEATLPLMVSPKVKREVEAVRARVRRELGSARSREPRAEAPPDVAPAGDRPEQAVAPSLTPALEPPPPSLTPQVEARVSRRPVLPWVLLGTGVVAGGVGGYFGGMSRSQVAAARGASQQSEAAQRLDEARGSARVANVLWVGAGVAAVGALVSWWLHEGSAETPSTGEVP
ncbi:hypothetical protein [Melittangium boletus]|uniref:hypothetical protein n=1 Tax=Melittangium boletus TaxID=83453 RepID=UPI003DA1D688